MRKFRAALLALIFALSGAALTACSDAIDPGVEQWRDVQHQLKDDTLHADKVILSATFEVDKSVPEAADAALSFDPVYNSGMVLQQGAVNMICGWTTAQHIAVQYRGKIYYGTVSEDNTWKVYLPVLQASNTAYRLIAYTESGRKTLKDIYVGEVFMCAGQSNMDISLAQFAQMGNLPGRPGNNHQADVNSANDPLLRLFLVDNTVQTREPVDVYGTQAVWQGASPSSAGNFSAVGYLFGRRMREVLKVPVGLIDTAVGGTGIVYWMSNEGFQELVQDGVQLYADTRDPSDESIKINPSVVPALGYNGVINPLRHLKIRGTVWYQGETDAMGGTTSDHYEQALAKLASDWREVFECPDMFWTIVELPRWDGAGLLDAPTAYARIRTAQQNFAKNDKLGAMSVAIDLGEWTVDKEDDSIHPNDKSEISLRAANETLYRFYGSSQLRNPTLYSYERLNRNEVRFTFEHVGAGMVLKNLARGFEVSADGVSFTDNLNMTATVSDDGKSVTVKTDTDFTAIRYGVKPAVTYDLMVDVSRQVTLYSSAGLPVDQFTVHFE